MHAMQTIATDVHVRQMSVCHAGDCSVSVQCSHYYTTVTICSHLSTGYKVLNLVVVKRPRSVMPCTETSSSLIRLTSTDEDADSRSRITCNINNIPTLDISTWCLILFPDHYVRQWHGKILVDRIMTAIQIPITKSKMSKVKMSWFLYQLNQLNEFACR